MNISSDEAAQLTTQVYSSVYVAFFSDSHNDNIELANKNKVIPTATNLSYENNFTFKGHKLHSFGLACHYWSLGSCHLILPNLHSGSHSWAAAVCRTSHRYMDLLLMNKNLHEFIRTKANSVLLPASLLHPFHDVGKSENLTHFFVGHNSLTSCRHIDPCTHPCTVSY